MTWPAVTKPLRLAYTLRTRPLTRKNNASSTTGATRPLKVRSRRSSPTFTVYVGLIGTTEVGMGVGVGSLAAIPALRPAGKRAHPVKMKLSATGRTLRPNGDFAHC